MDRPTHGQCGRLGRATSVSADMEPSQARMESYWEAFGAPVFIRPTGAEIDFQPQKKPLGFFRMDDPLFRFLSRE